MKILIIGGSGFLGLHLAQKLIKEKKEVIIYDKVYPKINNYKFKFIRGDIKNYRKLKASMTNVNIVYHFAGISDIEYSMKNPQETLETNIISTYKILKCCVKKK